MTILTLAAVTALAISPSCGAAKPDSDLARRLVATAQAESGLDPYVIHINGPDGGARHYASEVDAIVAALELDVTNTDYDAGLLQINRRNFARHGLTLLIGGAFNPCRSMRAGSDHLTADFRAVWSLASRRYNCGNVNCGAAYAQRVDTLVAQSGNADLSTTAPAAEPLLPPKSLPLRDALHAPDSGGLIDLLAGQHPRKPAPITTHENKDSNEDAH